MPLRHGLCEPAVYRRRGALAVRRREEERQRPPVCRGPDRGRHSQDRLDRQPCRGSQDGTGITGGYRLIPRSSLTRTVAIMWHFDNTTVPSIRTPLPGPRAQGLLARDHQFMSPSYTRIYPLVVSRGSGAVIEDVDGNLFLDFTAGIAVTASG